MAKQTQDNPAPIFDCAVEAASDDVQDLQRVKAPFCWLSGDVRLKAPTRHISVHTARTRRFGRAMPPEKIGPLESPGAVYRYEALAAGQTFGAAILCDREEDANTLKTLLAGEASLGGSRSAGYGRVRFENVDERQGLWREADGSLTYHASDVLIMTLLSDALLRDSTGQFVANSTPLREALEKRLGCTLNRPRAFMGSRTVGGFNRKWGLPLPQTPTLRMGSVFVFEPIRCTVEKLRELEATGIGERRAEGFGRMVINWNIEGELEIDPSPGERMSSFSIPGSSQSTSGSSLSPQSREVAQRMATRLLKRRLDAQVLVMANRQEISRPPSRAQISRLRNIIHDEMMQPSPKPMRIGEFLAKVKERSTVRRQFERARIGGKRLWDWLDETRSISTNETWEGWLGLRGEEGQYLRSVGGIPPEITDSLRTEYLLRFMDAVLARAAKQSEGQDEP